MRTFLLLAMLARLALPLAAQTDSPLNCTATAVPALIRIEGLAERVGDIVLNCSGGIPNGRVRGDFRVISFAGNITNKRNLDTGVMDAVITVDVGSGPTSTGATALYRANNQFDFAAMDFQLGPAGTATFRITNVRVVPPQQPETPFRLALATNGPSAIRVDNSPLTVAIASRGLLASYSSTFVCTRSPLPELITYHSFLDAGVRFASLRFTEGSSQAFARRETPSDQGTRLVVRLGGLPAGSRIFVPDAVAGSTADIPTAAGDLGLNPHAGRYTSTPAGQMLLVRILNPDAAGAGGTLAFTPIPGTTSFGVVSEVPVNSGEAFVVYEVADSNPASVETLQFPVFLGLEERPTGGFAQATLMAGFGPISTDALPSQSPVPRFQAITPPPDCQALGDCNSGIFPRLGVEGEALNFNPLIGQFPQVRYIQIRNDGGGLLNWTASVTYTHGSGWLTLDPAAGVGNSTLRIDANAAGLTPGIYEAALRISGGPLAGAVTLPVRMEARLPGTNPQLPPEIHRYTNGATFAQEPLAPGSIGTAFGARFSGESIALTINGSPARILFANDTQINFEVPPGLPVSGSVLTHVTVDSRNSPSRLLPLAPVSPGIFSNAILNQDYSVNGPANPAPAGTVVQIFATGIAHAADPITVRIHDYTVTPLYAGPAPGFIGLDQVNAQVPPELQPVTSTVRVCAGAVCSPERPITTRLP